MSESLNETHAVRCMEEGRPQDWWLFKAITTKEKMSDNQSGALPAIDWLRRCLAPYPLTEDAELVELFRIGGLKDVVREVAALTAENERQSKAISFAIGWLSAMLERRQYEDDHELREMQDMLAAAQLVEVKEHG